MPGYLLAPSAEETFDRHIEAPHLRTTSGSRRNAQTHCDRKYLKAMRAAVRHVASIQACIQCDPRFRQVRSAHRLERDPLVRKLTLAGILTAINVPLEKIRMLDRAHDLRADFLYFFQENVRFSLTVRESARDGGKLRARRVSRG